jgi:uncharacterized membrane protein required for colicin V production
MLKPSFVDFILVMALIVFSMKGVITGSIRSAVTLISVALAWFFSALLPTIAGLLIGYLLPDSSPNYLLINRLSATVIFFIAFQSGGFLLTGLFENIHLGSFDKFFGFVLGVSTAVFIVSLPGTAILETPGAFAYKPNQRYFQESQVMKQVRPLSTSLARPVPRGRHGKTR